MKPEYSNRTSRLLGEEGYMRLADAHVAVFGIGGVGGHAAEALWRAGVGSLTLIDGDSVAPSNLNRQLVATQAGIGRPKVSEMAKRLREIRQDGYLLTFPRYFSPESMGELLVSYDYVIDAIDDVPNKVLLIAKCYEKGIPIVSSMGAGNRLDPSRFRMDTLANTRVDPLAKAVRKGLRGMNVPLDRCMAAWSPELPRACPSEDGAPGSVSFVPGAVGLILAGHVVCALSGVLPEGDGV